MNEGRNEALAASDVIRPGACLLRVLVVRGGISGGTDICGEGRKAGRRGAVRSTSIY